MTPRKPKERRLTVHDGSSAFRVASERMGLVEKGKQQPFRPKRFRRIFRTACRMANLDNGMIDAMMGHKTDVSGSYLEKPKPMFMAAYSRIEEFVTVGEIEQAIDMTELRESVTKPIAKLEAEVQKLEEFVDTIYEIMRDLHEGPDAEGDRTISRILRALSNHYESHD